MSMLPTVRRQLVEAVERRAQPDARASLVGRLALRRAPRLTAGSVGIAALVAVPAVIAAGALILLGAHRPPPSPPAQAHPETARQQLIDHFGVLRRAQTPADRDNQLVMPAFSDGSASAKLDASLMRVVRVSRFDAKVAFEPITWQPSPSAPRRSEGLELVLWIGTAPTIPPSSEDATGPVAIPSLLTHGLVTDAPARDRSVIDGVVAVPDKVARIVLRPIRMDRAPVKVDPKAFGAATATVQDNVAAFLLHRPTVAIAGAVSGDFATGGVAEVTWFDATGKVLKRTTTNLGLFIRVVGTRA